MSLENFISDEAGAVTIDWVVLAAGLLLLSVPTVGFLSGEVQFVMDSIEANYVEADGFALPVND